MNKKIETFNLDGDEMPKYYYSYSYDADRELNVIWARIKMAKYHDEKSLVIKVHFSGDNTYGDFVYLVNMMALERIQCYIYNEDDFYIFLECGE